MLCQPPPTGSRLEALGAVCLGRWLLGGGPLGVGGAPAPCKQRTPPPRWLGGGGCHTQHQPGGGSWLCFPAGCGPAAPAGTQTATVWGRGWLWGRGGAPVGGSGAGGRGPESHVRGRGDAAGFVPGLAGSRRGKPGGTPGRPERGAGRCWRSRHRPGGAAASRLPAWLGGGILGPWRSWPLPGGGRGLGRSRAAVGTLLSVWAALRGRPRREDCSPPPALFRSPELWEPFV